MEFKLSRFLRFPYMLARRTFALRIHLPDQNSHNEAEELAEIGHVSVFAFLSALARQLQAAPTVNPGARLQAGDDA